MRVGYLHREDIHSKGSEGSDRLILAAVLQLLREQGCHTVEVPAPVRGTADLLGVHAVLTMSRTIEVASALTAVHAPPPMINDPTATLMTLRENLYPALAALPVCMPATQLADLAQGPPMAFPFWLKRRDYHHILPGDVALIDSERGFVRARAHFARQGYRDAFAQEHVPGRRIKFYGVFERDRGRVAFMRTEEVVAEPLLQRLEDLAGTVLRRIPLVVFGIDVLVRGDDVYVVDVNSWPSFKTCREAAAHAIAAYVVTRLGSRGGACTTNGRELPPPSPPGRLRRGRGPRRR